MDIFFEIHQNLPREGPGDTRSTIQALSFIQDIPIEPLILDIACGLGMQTIDLSGASNGKIIALDNHPPFLAQLLSKIRSNNIIDKISIVNGSMFALPFMEKLFDLIWSEGAIYIIGFKTGLCSWKRLLKPGGYLAVTEISWLNPNPPTEISDYWFTEYPGMHNIEENVEIINSSGYTLLGKFKLPDESWWLDYYKPLETRLRKLKSEYSGNFEAMTCIDSTELEINMFKKYSEWYGYVFYVMKAV